MQTNPKASTPSPDSAVTAVLATDTLNATDNTAAASATPEASAVVPSKTLLQLLQDPPLLAIALNFDPLKKAADRLKLSDDQLAQYHKILTEIADHITEVNKYIAYENTEHAVSAVAATAAAGNTDSLYMTTIADCLEKLRESIRQLDKLASLKNRPLITAIKHRIERSFELLNRAVRKRLHSDAIGRQEVPWQMHAFHSEQSVIAQDADQHTALESLLSDLSKIFTFDGKPPQCFISYAWPTAKHRFQESWVPLFLKTLCAHLRSAGIHALLDIEDNVGEKHSEYFSQGAKACEYGLVFCTPSLNDRIDALNYSSVQRELNLIKEKHEQDRAVYKQSRVIYMLGAGHEHESLPEEWVDRELIFNWREKSYTQSLKMLLSSLYASHYPESSEDYNSQWTQFNAKWEAYYAAQPDRTKALTPEQVQAQLSNPAYASRIAALDDEILKEQQYQALQAYYQQQIEDADALFSTPLYQLPQRNLNFTGRQSQLDQIARQLESNSVGVITQSVAGLGGVGKSSLVLEYAHTARMTEAGNQGGAAGAAAVREVGYDYIVWLSAREPLTAFSSFAQDVLGLDPKAYKNDHATLMRQIYMRLSQAYPNVLLVLDDVSNKDKVEPYLPKEKYSDGKLHILLTSRSAHWTGHAVIELDVFDPTDARTYILKLLNPAGQTPTETTESADELAKALGYFPLALSQAVAYIQQTGCGIVGYLTRYAATHDNKAKLLKVPSEQTPEALAQHAHQKMVYTTWYLSIESLRATLPEAEHLLNVCAYYAPDPIPNRVINRAFSKDDFGFNKILRGLRDYSLIAVEEQESIQLHQLLQEIIRLHHQAPEKREECIADSVNTVGRASETQDWIVQGLNLLDLAFTYDKCIAAKESMVEWQNNKPLLTHIELMLIYFEGFHTIGEKAGQLANSAGLLSGDLGNYQKKAVLLERALIIKEEHFGRDHIEVAGTLINFGEVSRQLGNARQSKVLLKRALKIFEAHYPSDHIEMAGILNNLGITFGELGDVHNKKVLCERALLIEEAHFSADNMDMVIILGNLAVALGDLGDTSKKKTLLKRILKIEEVHYDENHPTVAKTLTNLGNAYGVLGNVNQQKTLQERALKILESHYGHDHVEVAKTLVNLGEALQSLGNAHQSKVLLERALAIFEDYYGFDHVDIAKTLTNLGIAFGDLGDVNQQKTVLERALAIEEKHYGGDHVGVAKTLTNLGNAFGDLGDVNQKKTLQERALTIKEKHYGNNHVEVAITLGNLANAIGDMGDVHKKIALLNRALKIEEVHYGVDHIMTAETLMNLGNAFGDLGKLDKKKAFCERALAIKEKHYGSDHPKVAETLVNLGAAMESIHESRALYERALYIQEGYYGVNHFETAQTLMNLGITFGQSGSPDISKDLLKRALVIKKTRYCNDHPEIGLTLINLAITNLMLGEKLAAIDHVTQALKIFQAFYADPRHADIQRAQQILQMCQHFGDQTQAPISAHTSTSEPTQRSASRLVDHSLAALVKKYKLPDASQSSLEKAFRMAVVNHFHTDIKFLLQQVHNINTQDSNPNSQKTALHWAVLKGNKEAISLLLKTGARYDIPDSSCKMALDYAHEADDIDLIRLFIEFFLEEEGMDLSSFKIPVLSRNFFEFLQEKKILPLDLPYTNFEKHFASHVQRAEVQQAYSEFLAGRVSVTAAAGSSLTSPPTSAQTSAPGPVAASSQSSTAAVTASSTSAGLFGVSQPASHLAQLLLQTQKQIPESGQVQLIFKTQTEAEDCQRQLQAASAAASATGSLTDYAIEAIRIIDEDKADASAASTAAAVHESYAITLIKADYNRILRNPRAYDELVQTFQVMQQLHS